MGNPLAGIGMDSNRSQFMARQRIESHINLPRLFAATPVSSAQAWFTSTPTSTSSPCVNSSRSAASSPSASSCAKSYSSTEIRHATLTQLKDALGGLLGILGSYRTGHVGTAETIAIGLYEDLTE
ncbi:hypothetical protein PS664_01271 [Pseudomonas fluorescens]|nr:hypothetical protein PS664_01271 [Pseudomonas fluorescens]